MRVRSLCFTAAAAASLVVMPLAFGDDYNVDTMHSGVTFQISHLGLSWIQGRFNEYSGTFSIDSSDPAKSSFNFSVKPESIDTANAKRDEHLKSPDFFNVKQFPTITFKSTSVKAVKDGYEVAGDLTLHGKTVATTFILKGGRSAEFPKGVQRTGYTSQFVIKRSDFGVGQPTEAIGDDVYVVISFEGVKK